MTDKIVAGIFVIVGIINLLPAIVFFDAAKTVKLYGVALEGEDLPILMRHRGVLLALVGAILIYAAFKPEFRVFAVCAALASKFAFLYLTLVSGNGYSAEIRQVALIDVGAIAALVTALAVHLWAK